MHRPLLIALALVFVTGCEPESSTPSPNTCGPSNCAGCCAPDGSCQGGTVLTACGAGGAACQTCGTTQTCEAGVCKSPSGPSCNSSNCGGCCSGDQCLAGNQDSACGQAGLECKICGGSEVCAGGQCSAICNAATCPNGCCKNGACVEPSQQGVQQCGAGGAACQNCGNGEQCVNQACTKTTCDSSNCQGCCDSVGNCKTGGADSACGAGGQACAVCDGSKNETCMNGGCQTVNPGCNATTCANGCCDDQGQCVPGNAPDNCGTGGNACAQCGSNLACVSQKCTCTTTSCPGCCDGDTCKAGSDVNACGAGGAACTQCTGTKKCVAGTCQDDCSFLTCTGCCNGTTCVSPVNVSNCGAYGKQCQQCGSGDVCEYGTCNDKSKCSSSNCPTGCCKDGSCQAGTFDNACGAAGRVCELCGEHLYCGKDPFLGTQECLARDSSTWDVIVVKVKLNDQPTSDWDSFLEKPEPDVFVEVDVGSKTGKTSQKDNQFTPAFDDFVLTASAKDLRTKITYRIKDKDFFGADLIGECVDVIYPAELKDGGTTIYGCGGAPNNTDVLSITFKFVVKSK